jgi:hypothetical protein
MWAWTTVALAQDLTLEQARTRGVPDRHTALRDCDCVELVWNEDAGTARYVVEHAALREVRHDRGADGRHDLSFLLAGGDELLIERAPCAVTTPMASDYSVAFGVPLAGSAVEGACADTLGPLRSYLTPRFEALGVPDYGPLATLTASTRAGRLELPPSWAAERPMLGRCFGRTGEVVPGRVVVVGRLGGDGHLTRLRIEEVGPAEVIDGCVLERLGGVVGDPGRPQRVRVEVEWSPPPGP